MRYEAHPAAALFPMLSDAELRELADDIETNGQIDPIVIYESKILDGRNRYAACELVGVEPKFEFANGNIGSPIQFVISKNLHRRQLTVSQRAAIGAELLPMLQEEQSQAKDLARGQNGRFQPAAEGSASGDSAEAAGKLLGVSGSTVERAASVKRDNPEIFEKVKRGEITVNAARHGHSEQPKIGGGQPRADKSKPFEITKPRHQQIADAAKRRMIDGLSMLGGICSGLETFDVAAAAAVCTNEEIGTWATQAELHAGDLRRFAAKLRKAKS